MTMASFSLLSPSWLVYPDPACHSLSKHSFGLQHDDTKTGGRGEQPDEQVQRRVMPDACEV